MADPREIAAQLLRQRERSGEYIEDLLAQVLERERLTPADRGLAQELTYGVVRRQALLDWLIERKTPGRTQKVPLQILLRLGLYQLFCLDRIPDHAAVNETVALARRLGFGPQSGFVNAVLRGYLRERDATRLLLEELKSQRPALAHSHPDWLFDRWEQRWGRERAVQLMEWNNQPPKTFARPNLLKVTVPDLLAAWAAEGVRAKPLETDWAPGQTLFELCAHPALTSLPSFQNGFFYVQDPSTLLAPHLLAPQPEESLLDLCAAPGGKTTYLAQLTRNRGRIAARDLSPDRLQLLSDNCARLGVTCVEISGPSPAGSPAASETFDRVLLDAPCSNTGVMRRRVDLRWRLRPQELGRLQETQLRLLRRAAGHLQPGGRLVYSTCSLEPEENRQVILRFLSEKPEFELELERELLPFETGFDGAYVARLKKPAG